jgi:hypothetical protein
MSLSVSVFSPEERSSADVDENYSKRERDWGFICPWFTKLRASVPVATLCHHGIPDALLSCHRYDEILPPGATQSCRLNGSGLNCQIQGSATVWRLRSPVSRSSADHGSSRPTKEQVTFYYYVEPCA